MNAKISIDSKTTELVVMESRVPGRAIPQKRPRFLENHGSPMSADILTNLTSLIPDIARILRAQADQMARRRGIVRSMYWPILMRLKRSPGLSQNEVAAMIGVAPMTITRLVDRLEALGLVRCCRGEDRRIWRLRLTREAASLVQEIARCRAGLHYRMALGIDPSILDTAHIALCKMRDNLSGSRPRRP